MWPRPIRHWLNDRRRDQATKRFNRKIARLQKRQANPNYRLSDEQFQAVLDQEERFLLAELQKSIG